MNSELIQNLQDIADYDSNELEFTIAFNAVLAHDAAQRVEIARLTAENESLKTAFTELQDERAKWAARNIELGIKLARVKADK